VTDIIYGISEAVLELGSAGLAAEVLAPGPKGDLAISGGPFTGRFTGAGLDSRTLEPNQLFIALPGENVHGRRFAADVLERGHWVLTDRAKEGSDPLAGLVSTDGAGVLVVDDPTAALGVLAAAWRARFDVPVIGVTGTNGKTTTKDLLAALLGGAGPTLATAGNYNNRLGVPVTLLAIRPRHEFAVIEMGASAVGEIDRLAALARPRIGLITNASPAHLAEFGSLAGIIEGKGELLDHLPENGKAILNADSPGFKEWRVRASCPVLSYGRDDGDHQWSWRPVDEAGKGEVLIDGEPWPCPLPGEHNGANLTAAVLAARAAGGVEADMRRGLAAFTGSDHRALVNMAAAGRAVAVLGHMAEMGSEAVEIHRDTGRKLAATGLSCLVAVGSEARPLIEGFDAEGGSGHYCETREEAARLLADLTAPGDRLLIKGSRSAAMEELLPLLEISFQSH